MHKTIDLIYNKKEGTERTKEIVFQHIWGNKQIMFLKTTNSDNSIGTPFRGAPKMSSWSKIELFNPHCLYYSVYFTSLILRQAALNR